MDKVYRGQDLKLTLVGLIDIGGGATAAIEYGQRAAAQKGVYASKPATVEEQSTCKCYVDFVPANLDVAGLWLFWLRVRTAGNKTYIGAPYTLRVVEPGK